MGSRAAAWSRCCSRSRAPACWRACAGRAAATELGRPRRDIRLDEIVTVATAEEPEAGDGPAGRLQELVVDRLWNELEDTARRQLASLTLDDLVRRATAAGMRRPAAEPITFAI